MSDGSGWVEVARLGRTRGLKGDLFADAWSDSLSQRERVTLFRGEEPVGQFTVVSVSPAQGRWVVRFAEAPGIDEAASLTGCRVCIPLAERGPAGEGAYYLSDLVGCMAVEAGSNREIGVVESWQDYGGPPVFEIRRPGCKELLMVPFARAIWVKIDVAGRRVELKLPAGLEEV